jgi:tRNA nucleotidyltransferase (CCA-adding enzyme)
MDALSLIKDEAPWLLSPDLGVCIVGSQALAIACREASIDGPDPSDLDLSWALAHEEGAALLTQHGVLAPTTTGNQERGTLACKIGGLRVEITSFRAGDAGAPMPERIEADLSERDMTIGAIAVEVATGRVHDPLDGLQHYRDQRIVPVGDPAQRVNEHGIRWLRYFRKAHELGFLVDNAIRGLKRSLDPSLLLSQPKEAVALELRAILTKTKSPGRCLLDLHEVGLLATLSPSLAQQFDGRPAGPQRWHPEVSQALHMILALDWAVANTQHLVERDRTSVLFAVLCHDLGKGDSPSAGFPHHRGHEGAGVDLIEKLTARWPGLMDQRTTTLAKHVSALHLEIRRYDELRPRTRAKLYEDYFRAKDYPIELFATAVAADSAGRLGFEQDGPIVRDRVTQDIEGLREACSEVDAGALRLQFPDDLEAFRSALHQARTKAIRAQGR